MTPWTSPWDGGDRRILRAGIAVLAVFDAVYLLRGLVFDPELAARADAPGWLALVASSRPVLAITALIVVWTLLRFARGRHPLLTGLAGLTALAVLAEAYATTHAGPYRANFFSGAMLLGWIAGEGAAAVARREPGLRLRWGEAGAIGVLAAAYVGAGTGKLLGAGVGWADGTTLRGVIRSHAPAGEGLVATLADVVASSPGLAAVASLVTIVVQVGAVAYPLGRRSRVVLGIALIGFHVGVALTTRIGYWQPVIALALFSFPWPRLLRPLRRPEPDDDPLELSPVVLAVPVAVVLAAWLNPWRAYTQGHHRSSDPQPTGSRAADHVGPLRVGDTLTNGWTIEAIHLEPDRAQLILVREGTRAIAWLRPREEHQPGSPFDTTACRIAYGETAVDLDDVRPALDALSRKIANATDDPNVVRAWLDG
jgi:hypothetical protein